MKRIEFIVEGQTECEFVKNVITPYLIRFSPNLIVSPITIRTSKNSRGGLTKYKHLQEDLKRTLSSKDSNLIVTTFIDFFRIPSDMPSYNEAISQTKRLDQLLLLEKALCTDINDLRFIPYIQLHEFEALLFSSNSGFMKYFTPTEVSETEDIVNSFENPEDINTTPKKAPSKRLLAIRPDYNKVIYGNIIALEVTIDIILERCPHFKQWIETLKSKI